MQAQAQLKYENIVVALDRSSSIAFVRPPQLKTYIDLREGLTAIWDKGLVKIGEIEYNYNTWHSLSNESDLYKYFKSLIDSDYVPMQQFTFL